MAFVDGSREPQNGVEFAGFGVWSGQRDDRNECSPVTVAERQSMTSAELQGALRVLQLKLLGKPVHLMTNSDIVYLGLIGKCEKWSQNKGWGRGGARACTHLWQNYKTDGCCQGSECWRSGFPHMSGQREMNQQIGRRRREQHDQWMHMSTMCGADPSLRGWSGPRLTGL